MAKYHIALSFAGEDRAYVERVAEELKAGGVEVFYDKFEEAELWGKNLYEHLSEVYRDRALFTVIFVSDAYSKKLWSNHERKSAQARAFTESKEYVLPAFFDTSVEVPGLHKTIGYIDLKNRSPEQFAKVIIDKLKASGVRLPKQFSYSAAAKADADFPLKKGSSIAEIIRQLKVYTWSVQKPAVRELLALDWDKVDPDTTFVLGRNLYQCACGSERTAIAALDNLRQELAAMPDESALHFLNGMLFEAYFDSSGEFRGQRIKRECLDKLLALQEVKKYAPSIKFIRKALEPYSKELPFIPDIDPEPVEIKVSIKKSNPPAVKSLTLAGRDLLVKDTGDNDEEGRVWKLSHVDFTLDQLKRRLAEEWSIPVSQITVKSTPKLEPKTKLRIPDGWSVKWPSK